MQAFSAQDVIIPELLSQDLITPEDLERAERMADPDPEGRGALYFLLKQKFITPMVVLPILSAHFKVEAADPEESPEEDALAIISREIAVANSILPLREEDGKLVAAVANPHGFEELNSIEFAIEREIKPLILDSWSLSTLIDLHYATITEAEEDTQSLISQDLSFRDEGVIIEDVSTIARQEEIDSAPVVKILNGILAEAVRKKASDIHFESFELDSRVRYRIDGALIVAHKIPKIYDQALITRLKIQAKLDISQKRLPQDGRITFMTNNRKIDFRLSTCPTGFGEKIVLRILDRNSVTLDMKDLGIEGRDKEVIMSAIEHPNGIILLTGPTGSGKTTTLYTMLAALNDSETNIMTAEDPVEYDLPGINQVGMNKEIGMTFEVALRAFLRQDPDVILVGEMRDNITATIGIQAAQTGHLVLSTLHTNDASRAITRLTEMDVDRFQIGATVRLIIAQRLVRQICKQCRAETTYDEYTLKKAGLSKEDAAKIKFFHGKGCDNCNKTGYRGRIAIYEMLPISTRIEEMIYSSATAQQIKQVAVQEGMKTLRVAGLERVKAGVTTLKEIVAKTPAG